MPVVVIVGAQWGDEGKGKVVDLYTERADLVARWAGGANAGHTLVVDGQKLVTHLIPSGVLRAGVTCILGDGMVVDPRSLLEEIAGCRERGLLARREDLLVGRRAHVILPYHKALDELRERGAGKGAIGTTKRGIGPAYESKVTRRGVRIGDLLLPDRLAELVTQNLACVNPELVRLGGTAFEAGPIIADALGAGQELAQYMGDAPRAIADAIRRGRAVLCEGAQGALLDLDHGTYPYVTSSSTIAGGACTGLGIGPTAITSVIGITKAYATRVGAGPFPTEMHGPEGERLRKAGDEFGSTTGRPRRCGWLDLPALRVAIRTSGIHGLAVTKLDVLGGIRPLKICTGYRLHGELLDELPIEPHDLVSAEPVYEQLEGWNEDVRGVRELADLPVGARRYLDRLQGLAGIPLVLVSVGPARAETIVLEKPFR